MNSPAALCTRSRSASCCGLQEEDPPPSSREILMRVRATSLNYRDLMLLKGGGRGPAKVGVIPLSDGQEVAPIGEQATGPKSTIDHRQQHPRGLV